MAEASAGTSVRTVSDISVGLLQKLKKLGGVRPRSDADYAVPSDDSAELMLVTRNFLYAMEEVKAKTCAFPNTSNEASDESDGEDVSMDSATTAAEDTLIRLARHLLFACGNVNKTTFKYVVLFILGSFGRHCRSGTCARGEACSLRGQSAYEDTEDYVDDFLKLDTPIAWMANFIIQMRVDAMSHSKLSTFERVTEGHAALLASLVYPSACSQSLKAKCFELFGPQYNRGWRGASSVALAARTAEHLRRLQWH